MYKQTKTQKDITSRPSANSKRIMQRLKFADNRPESKSLSNLQFMINSSVANNNNFKSVKNSTFQKKSFSPIQKAGFDSLELAVDALDSDSNKQNHILAKKHKWDLVVIAPSWSTVKPIMKDVVNTGDESTYKGTSKKSSKNIKNINGEKTETVDVTWVKPKGYFVSDGWVRS